MRTVRLIACALLAVAPVASAFPAAAVAAPAGDTYPRPAVCVDQAAVLGAQTCARITRVLEADERATTDEIAVVVVHSTGGVAIQTWGTGLFNSWGVGKQGENNGVLLVVATDDRRLRIVTGSGLADRLPDGTAGEIIGGTITPLFQDGRIRDGILAGLDQIRRHLGHDVNATNQLTDPNMAPIPAVNEPPAEPASGGTFDDVFWVVIAVLVFGGNLFRVIARRLGWISRSAASSSSSLSGSPGSSSSSSRSSFGGGSSRGGGASGSW